MMFWFYGLSEIAGYYGYGYAPEFFSTAVKNGDVSWTGMWRHL